MKKLYTFGDSLTDPNFTSEFHPELDCSYPKWPDLVAKNLSMGVKNFGVSNNNNWLMVHDCLNAVTTQDDVGCVMILWSSPMRHPYGRLTVKPRITYATDRTTNNIDMWLHKFVEYDKNLIRDFTRNFYEQVTFIKAVLTKYNIPHVMGLGFNLDGAIDNFRYPHKPIIWKEWIKCMDSGDIVNEEFIGWPLLEDFAGYSMLERLNQFYSKSEYQVSDLDAHPNAFGHEFIAEQFIDRYSDLYK